MFLLVFPCFFRRRKQIPSPLPPHRLQVYLLPLEGVRGVDLVTYSDVINIGLPIWEGLGGLETSPFVVITITACGCACCVAVRNEE